MAENVAGAGLLAGKSVFVSGAGRGIGAAAALLFAQEGASVMLMSRTEEELAAVTKEIRESGGTAAYTVGSVEDAAAVSTALDSMTSLFGGVDGAFNNAGARLSSANLIDVDERDLDAEWSLNLRSVWVAMRLEILAIRASSGVGSIVNNSSVASLHSRRGSGMYAAAKRALNSLTATAAVEHGPEGIRVNAIAPGLTVTPMALRAMEQEPQRFAETVEQTPLGRTADPREISEAAASLISDRASYVTGIVLPVDGGLRA